MAQDFSTSDADDDCAHCPDKTENIIIVGSEFEYMRAGFQLKLMFLSCGYAVASGTLLPRGWGSADKTTIAYVPMGYNRWERLNLDYLRDNLDVNIVRLTSVSGMTNLLRERGAGADRHAIKNLILFCHGLPNYLALNYRGPGSNMRVYAHHMTALPTDLFAPNGRIISYACRTAMEGYGQALADHFGVVVTAFKKRTNYGSVIRNRSDHEAIASQMAAARVGNEGQRIDLPPEHEAYPHPGLSAGTVPFFSDGGEAEGINDYALWRLNGARALPVSGTTPEDQPAGIFTLEPSA
ncbi:hypothetical protein [Yoonia sp. SDW83-1]|uniref:hypothetical protein n=1 Tax=Yoonia sp. SDW83-1 TaxID=3366945 RepID=UPI00398C75BA